VVGNLLLCDAGYFVERVENNLYARHCHIGGVRDWLCCVRRRFLHTVLAALQKGYSRTTK